jgi:hypothetical protein
LTTRLGGTVSEKFAIHRRAAVSSERLTGNS